MSVWTVYEQRKEELRNKNLTPKQYQDAIRRLIDELGI